MRKKIHLFVAIKIWMDNEIGIQFKLLSSFPPCIINLEKLETTFPDVLVLFKEGTFK